MNLKERIHEDLKNAMKAQDKKKVSALRMLVAAIKNAEIEKIGQLEDGEVMQVIKKEVKKWEAAIELYEQAGDTARVESEKQDIAVVSVYLQAQLNREDIEKIVDEAIAETGASSPGDLGKVMKAVMPKTQGTADGKLVNEIVREKLTPQEADKS